MRASCSCMSMNDCDPGHPEAHRRFLPISCALCTRCYLDIVAGRCIYGGGPFNTEGELDMKAWRHE